MARFAVIVSVIFSLFLLSHARLPSDLPDDSATETVSFSTVLEAVPKTELLLPTEKLESDFTTGEKPEHNTISAIGVTSFDGRLRLINRHFPHMHEPRGRRPFPFRFPHRCGHKHRHHPRGPGVMIPYGDDMIPAREFRFGGERRQIKDGRPGVMIPYGDDMIPAREFRFGGERRQIKDGRPGVMIPFGDDMIPAREFRFSGERRQIKDGWSMDEEYKMPRHVDHDDDDDERENGGFMKWIQDIVNRF